MAASDPFLVRAVQHIRDFAMDTIDEVNWPASKLVELIDTANGLVYGEMLASSEPKTHFRFAEAPITIQNGVEDYDWPGNVRRFLRLVKKDSTNKITAEILLTDYLSGEPGVLLLDVQRGFRLTPPPVLGADETWTLVYEAGVTPYLCYGSVSSATGTTAVLTAPSVSQLGTLSLEDGFYVNSYLRIASGTGAGQVRRITGYLGSTRTATVHKAWSVNPDATSIYEILPCLNHPLDKAIMWRTVMMMKASDADVQHRAMARDEYRDVMREVLLQVADRQGRTGPSVGQDHLDIFDMGESW